MDKYIYDDKNGLWYELQGDYYIPCLTLPAEKENKPIGVWGERHLRYLKEYRRGHISIFLQVVDSKPTLRRLINRHRTSQNS